MDTTLNRFSQQADLVLQTALAYAERGWPVLPVWRPQDGVCGCRKGTGCSQPGKHPRTHNGYQGATTDPAKVAKWKWYSANIGITTGRAAGLLVLDIDPRNGGRESMDALLERLGPLPEGPMVSTGGGGWHFYFRHPEAPVRKSSGIPGIDLKGDGGFVVAPPSVHHSGGVYRWEASPDDVPLPNLPEPWLRWATERGCDTDHAGHHRTSQEFPDDEGTSSGGLTCGEPIFLDEFVDECIRKTIPQHPGERHGKVFTLARYLQGHSEIATWKLSRLRPIVDRWYALAVETLGTEGIQANADDNWFDFAEGWGQVQYPGEGGLMALLLERAKHDIPEVAMQYQSEEVRLLVALCRQLQREAGDAPFFLATRTVAELFELPGATPQMRAWRWLQGLVLDGVLELIERGDSRTRMAAQFRYLYPVD